MLAIERDAADHWRSRSFLSATMQHEQYYLAENLGYGPHQWHHIAAIYDGRFVRLVVDGRLVSYVVDGGSAGGNIHYHGTPNLTIGTRSVVDVGNFFDGTIDEVKLFNAALNTAQVRAAMQSPVPEEFAVSFRDGTIPSPLAATMEQQQVRLLVIFPAHEDSKWEA